MKVNVYFVQYHIGDYCYEDYIGAPTVEAALLTVREKFDCAAPVVFDQVLRSATNVEVADAA